MMAVVMLALLTACTSASETPAPAPTQTEASLPPVTQTAPASATLAPTLTATSLPSPTFTLTPLPSLTPTPVTLAERIPIIEYHNPTFVLSDEVMMTPEWFGDQLRWLSENGFYTLSSAELAAFVQGQPVPQKSVVLSFDIGLPMHSEYTEIVIPALRQYGMHAVIFLLVSENVIVDTCGQGETFCWEDLRGWAEEGLISVESHGMWHVDYAVMSAENQRWDAGQSKAIIEEKIGQPVDGFAYPFDSYTPEAQRIVASLGYRYAAAGFSRPDRSVYLADPSPYALPRVYPYSSLSLYPVLSSTSGLTFPEMMWSQVALVGWQTPTPAATLTTQPTLTLTPVVSTPTPGAATPTPAPVEGAEAFMAACQTINRLAEGDERNYAFTLLNFNTDLSAEAQAALAGPVQIWPSCNVQAGNQPRAIVLHATRGPLSGALNTFRIPSYTSAHYVIDRDGTVYQVVPETISAFHASCTGYRGNCQASCTICDGPDGRLWEPYEQSIGIELVNQCQIHVDEFDGPVYEDFLLSFGWRYWEDYTESQIAALRVLVNDLRARWDIPWEMVMGHYQINDKSDPGPALNLFWTRPGNPPREPIFDTSQP